MSIYSTLASHYVWQLYHFMTLSSRRSSNSTFFMTCHIRLYDTFHDTFLDTFYDNFHDSISMAHLTRFTWWRACTRGCPWDCPEMSLRILPRPRLPSSTLKVDGSEKWGGSGRRSSLRFSLRLWRSRVICNLNMSFLSEKHISVSACYR